MVVQSSRSGEYHLRTHFLYGAMLVHCGATAIETHRAQTASHRAEHVVGLQGELTARHYHHRLHLLYGCVKALHEVQKIGKGFATAGGCEYHDVTVGMEHGSRCVLLHLSEF